MSTKPEAVDDCWNRIGIHGDRSCPKLDAAIHCRNCEVFRAAALTFLDRPIPGAYAGEHGGSVAAAATGAASAAVALLVFRIGAERLAIPAAAVAEVTDPAQVRVVPHRGNGALLGIVNVGGQIDLQVALDVVLGIDAAGAPSDPRAQPRLIVLSTTSGRWAFRVAEVQGVAACVDADLAPPPETILRNPDAVVRAIARTNHGDAGVLDVDRLGRLIEARLA